MKKIIYFSSIFICSLILIGSFFVLPAKATVTDDPNAWDTGNQPEAPNNLADTPTPLDYNANLNPDNSDLMPYINDEITGVGDAISNTANNTTPNITITPNFNNGDFYVSIYFNNFVTGSNLNYTVDLMDSTGTIVSTKTTSNWLVEQNGLQTAEKLTDSVPTGAQGNYLVEVSTSDVINTGNSQIGSIGVDLTKDSTTGKISGTVASSTTTSPNSVGAAVNAAGNASTNTSSGATNQTLSNAQVNNVFLGSFNVSKLNTTLTGGKTLVDTLNPTTNSSHEKFWIFQVWRFCMSLINSIMVAFLIFLAFVNILRIQMDTYAIKKILPTLVLAVILANFSLLICRAVVDFSDVLVRTFVVSRADLANGLVNSLGLFKAANPLATIGVGSLAVVSLFIGAGGPASLLVILAGIIFALLPGIAILVLAFLLWIRVIVVQILVAFSPLAFIAMALPMTKNLFTKWWGQFANWTFMAVAIFFLLRIITLIQSATPGKLEIWTLVAAYVVLYLAIQVPFKMGGAIMSAWAGFGKTVTGIGKGGWLNNFGTMMAKRIGTKSLKSPLGRAITSTIVNKEIFEQTTSKAYEKAINSVWERKYAKVADKMNKNEKLSAEDMRIRSMHAKISAEEAQNFQDISPEGIERILQEQLGKDKKEQEQTLKEWWSGTLFKKDPEKALFVSALITALQKKRFNYMEGDSAQKILTKMGALITTDAPSSRGRLDLNAVSQVMRVAARPASKQIEGVTQEIANFNNQSLGKNQLEIGQEFETKIAPKLTGVKFEDLENLSFEDLSDADRGLLDQLTKLYERHGDIETIKTKLSPIVSAIISNPHYLIDKKELFTGAPEGLKKELGLLAEGGFSHTQLRANIPNLDLMLENSANLGQIISREKTRIKTNIENTLTDLKNIHIPGQTLNIPTGPVTLRQRMEINQRIQTIINDPTVSQEVKSNLKNRQIKLDKNFRLSNHVKTADKTLSDLISQNEPAKKAIESKLNPEEFVQ